MLIDTPTTEIQTSVSALAFVPGFTAHGICFAATMGGLRRSDDGGRTWHDAFASLRLATVLPATSVVVSPAFHVDRTVFAGVPGGILRSTDAGLTWSMAVLPPPTPFISCMTLGPNFAADGRVYAGTVEDGVLCSPDRGGRWDAWNIGLLDRQIICLAASETAIFAGVESGIFWSHNGGRFWNESPFPMDDAPVLSLALSPTFDEDGILFAGTEACGLARSTDRGNTWERLPGLPEDEPINAIIVSPDFPRTPDLLVMLDEGLLVSRDGGRSWADWQPAITFDTSLTAIAAPLGLDPGSPLLVGTIDGRVVTTNDY